VDVIRGDDALISERLQQLSDLLAECLEQGQPRAVLDMQKAALIDSAGLELLLDAQTDFQQRGGALKLAAVNALCEEILSVSGVADHLEIHPEVKTAVGSFAE
jgi:anti-sigma B factor antagonist